jgi:molecular chaperone DnaJ
MAEGHSEANMRKNYYVILGVASDASVAEIKAAFRRRALELHPDTSGRESGPFLELQEAYGVLGDPERRRRYDEQGGMTRPPAVRRRPWGPSPETRVRERRKAEPLRPIQTASSFREFSLADSFASYTPSFEELFDRWWSNFESISRPKSESLQSLTVEVIVTPEEARAGGRLRIAVPAQATCPACGGHGAIGPYACWRCEGYGALTAEYPVHLDYPPGVRDGYATRIPLDRFGVQNLYLTVLIRVGSQ